jgi:hypothetical protein
MRVNLITIINKSDTYSDRVFYFWICTIALPVAAYRCQFGSLVGFCQTQIVFAMESFSLFQLSTSHTSCNLRLSYTKYRTVSHEHLEEKMKEHGRKEMEFE